MLDASSSALAAGFLVEPGLAAYAPTVRWEVVVAIALLAGILSTLAAYAAWRRYGPASEAKTSLIAAMLALAFVAGGLGGIYVSFTQSLSYEQSAGSCAIGPWTATWRSSHHVFGQLPDNGSRSSFSIERVDPADLWPRVPANASTAFEGAGVTSIGWHPPSDRLGDWRDGFVSVSVEADGDGLRLFVRLEGQGVQDTARKVAVEALETTTNASDEAIDDWTAGLGGNETVEGPLVERGYPKNVTLDLAAFMDELGLEGWNVSWEPPIEPLAEPFEVHHSKGNWTLDTLAPVKLAKGEVNGTAVRLAVSSTNHLALFVDESGSLSDDEWNALAADVYGQLGIDRPPQRQWSPEPSAIC